MKMKEKLRLLFFPLVKKFYIPWWCREITKGVKELQHAKWCASLQGPCCCNCPKHIILYQLSSLEEKQQPKISESL